MGEAKRRGTYEERKAAAIKKSWQGGEVDMVGMDQATVIGSGSTLPLAVFEALAQSLNPRSMVLAYGMDPYRKGPR